jgi:hypothetical protein
MYKDMPQASTDNDSADNTVCIKTCRKQVLFVERKCRKSGIYIYNVAARIVCIKTMPQIFKENAANMKINAANMKGNAAETKDNAAYMNVNAAFMKVNTAETSDNTAHMKVNAANI